MKNKTNWHKDTISVRGGLKRSAFKETSEALFLNSGYVYDTAEEAAEAFSGDIDRFVYPRFGNPTVAMLEERLALMEGAEAALATGTGMASMFMSMAGMLSQGDRVVASRALFGACYSVIRDILPRWGIEVAFVDGTDLNQWTAALGKPAKIVFVETPSNPMLELVDIEAVTKLAHQAGALMVVDNVFGTQSGQSPLALGADVVMYSITKHHDGHGRVMGGALIGSEEIIRGDLLKFFRQTGPMISPFNAWVILKSMESMNLRVERKAENAVAVADFLSSHDAVDRIYYPHHSSHPQHELARRQMSHGGTILSFTIPGGRDEAFALLNQLELIDISNNLGDSKSLACHPASTTHEGIGPEGRDVMGIGENLIRLSLGLEHKDDLIGDLAHALGAL